MNHKKSQVALEKESSPPKGELIPLIKKTER